MTTELLTSEPIGRTGVGATATCDPHRWTIAPHGRMRVPVELWGDRATVAAALAGDTLPQLVNVAALPGVIGAVQAMPEVQPGYGFPIGTVAAFDARAGGVVVPGGIGYDINCGVRLLRSAVPATALRPVLDALLDDLLRCALFSPLRLGNAELATLLAHGAGWAVAHGCGIPADLDKLDWRGMMPRADARLLSERALTRGAGQLGTLGSGNHFIEIGWVEHVYDSAAADALGLIEGQATVLLHSGSRGLGSEVCADGVEAMLRAVDRYRIQLADRQLACAPLASQEGRSFLGAMAAAANYAFANRQVLTHRVREAVARALALPVDALGFGVVCDVPHNLASLEKHRIGGEELDLCVHRRGASRALPAGHADLEVGVHPGGRPVVVPGDMGRFSVVLLPGTAAAATFHSLPHGAGRCLGRPAARGLRRDCDCAQELAAAGIEVRSASPETLEECAPEAYHSLDGLLELLSASGLARPVVRLRPLGVLRG